MRKRGAIIVAGVAGVAGASWTTSDTTFVQIGCGLFWFLLVLALLLWARRSRGPDRIVNMPLDAPDPWVDEHGVQRFPGDVFDVANHPTPGRHGRL